MHLSFVTYDRPEERRVYLSGLEDKQKPIQTNSWLDGYDVGPNGFLRPHRYEQNEPSTSPLLTSHSPRSSFSLAGNKAATPGKASLVQERGQARQLISGRNFRDILEACRPRHLGASLPPPLESLLSLEQFALSIKSTKRADSIVPKKQVTLEDVRLREWGTVDLGKLIRLQTSSRSSRSPSPSANILKMTGLSQSASKAEKSQSSDSGSPGSSFACSPLSSTYGASFDRVFWEYYDFPKPPGKVLQIQRSPSFQFDGLLIETDRKDDFNTTSDTVSKSSIGGDSDNSQNTNADKHLVQLRQFMEAHDARTCTHVPVNDNSISGEKSESLSSGVSTKVAMARFQR
jgi:hypothetical protein